MSGAAGTAYTDDYGSSYSIHETKFVNPVTGADTLLFVLVNESGTVLRASSDTRAPREWVKDFFLKFSPNDLT